MRTPTVLTTDEIITSMKGTGTGEEKENGADVKESAEEAAQALVRGDPIPLNLHDGQALPKELGSGKMCHPELATQARHPVEVLERPYLQSHGAHSVYH